MTDRKPASYDQPSFEPGRPPFIPGDGLGEPEPAEPAESGGVINAYTIGAAVAVALLSIGLFVL
jgi:hypothetical protein